MKLEKQIEILLALSEKYYNLMLTAEERKDEIARAQYYAMFAAYDEAAKVLICDDYAEMKAKELGVEL